MKTVSKMFYSYFAVLFLWIGVGIGSSSKFIIGRSLNPKYCSPVHTGTGFKCRYELFKFFNGRYRNSGWETIYIAQKTEPPECPEPSDCRGEKLLDLSEYQKLANIQYRRDVKGVWISGKDYLAEVLTY